MSAIENEVIREPDCIYDFDSLDAMEYCAFKSPEGEIALALRWKKSKRYIKGSHPVIIDKRFVEVVETLYHTPGKPVLRYKRGFTREVKRTR